jgi:hypothetical protein
VPNCYKKVVKGADCKERDKKVSEPKGYLVVQGGFFLYNYLISNGIKKTSQTAHCLLYKGQHRHKDVPNTNKGPDIPEISSYIHGEKQ